jgi:DNA-binding beta-propeller fold protein YncE
VHGDRAYVTDTVGGAVLEYRLRPELRFARRIGIRGGPYGIAADPARERLWVTLTARNELVEIPMRRPRIVRRFPTVRAPDGVAVDPSSGRVLVAGSASGQLQIVDP